MATRGRPRAFDRSMALHRAMNAFWEHGYEGTSISDLTTAMGISSPSLYSAFGSKEQLLREAVAYYDRTEGAAIAEALRDRATARESIAAVLRHNAVAYCAPDTPAGCMIVLTATTCNDDNRAVHRHLAEWRSTLESEFAERIRRGIADGDVPADTDVETVAAFFNTVNHGMAVQARDDPDPVKLTRIAESAISAWDRLVTAPATTAPADGASIGSRPAD